MPTLDAQHHYFARFESKADGKKPGFYPNVLIIEKGPAKGHHAVKLESGRVVSYDALNPTHEGLEKYPVVVGDETLDDVVRCGVEAEGVKCKLDHGSTVRDLVGEYVSFRRDGDQVRADLQLLENSPHRAYAEEIIEKMSKKIGNSIDFDYIYEISGGKAVARCVKLNSVDIVDTPAATNSLFAKQQTNDTMPLTPEDKKEIAALFAEKLSEVETKFTSQFQELKTKFEEVKDELEDDEEKEKKEELEDDEEKKAEELAAKVSKQVLAAVKNALPKAALSSTNNEQNKTVNDDSFEGKLQQLKSLGFSEPQAIAHIARKYPAAYNAHMAGKTTL